MLFNSFEFILFFLPACLAVYYALGARQQYTAAKSWLVLSSLFFYGWWNPVYLLLIVASILVNFSIGQSLLQTRAKGTLLVGLIFNLGLLAYFKYANFFVDSVNAVAGTSFHLNTIILPLAISFFTFQQVAYLVDAYRNEIKDNNFLSYSLFVTFFPQLIAGPIVHHKQMLPQFAKPDVFTLNHAKAAIGLSIFFFGLFKKVVLADHVSVYGTPVFNAADAGATITFFEAWGGALAYTFQLYFDFSGYSDMAIGLGLLFGIYLPTNFNSPYKATSISDFWRRWHQTLSAFLREYLYIALGGNRKGKVRRYVNLMLTMLLGGLWHGAGWTFVLWGGLHGTYLVINHAWRNLLGTRFLEASFYLWMCRLLTFLAVIVSWVFFRAETTQGALEILSGMFGLNGAVLDARLSGVLSVLDPFVQFQGRHAGTFRLQGISWIILLTLIAFFAPNVAQIMRYVQNPVDGANRETPMLWQWRPSVTWLVIVVAAATAALFNMKNISEFLYFQF